MEESPLQQLHTQHTPQHPIGAERQHKNVDLKIIEKLEGQCSSCNYHNLGIQFGYI